MRRSSQVIGGVTILLADDFRQTLPVIPKGIRVGELNSSVKSSYLWNHVQKLSLTTNMKVHLQGDLEASDFSAQVLEVGNGAIARDNNGFTQLLFRNYVSSKEDLLTSVFPDSGTQFNDLDHSWLQRRAILVPHNTTMDLTNTQLPELLPRRPISFKSIDTTIITDDATMYPIEFLNSLTSPGLPNHDLQLKVSALVILLRNVDPPTLCNGTQMTKH